MNKFVRDILLNAMNNSHHLVSVYHDQPLYRCFMYILNVMYILHVLYSVS